MKAEKVQLQFLNGHWWRLDGHYWTPIHIDDVKILRRKKACIIKRRA